MSTRWESYCNTTTDLMVVEPQIDSYDRKRLINGFVLVSGTTYTKGNAGFVSRLFRDGTDLGAAQATVGAVDTNGEWFYDSTTDLLTLCSTANPNTSHSVEAGRLWSDVKTEAVARASEFVRSYLAAKPIIKRTGTGEKAESLRDYDDNIVRATAYLACAEIVEPYDAERGLHLRTMAYDATQAMPGILDLIKRGDLSMWNEITAGYNTGIVRAVVVDASTPGGIVETAGTSTVAWDKIKVKIATGGDFLEGTASTVTFGVWVGDTSGVKRSQVTTAEVINGAYQALAHGIYGRFAAGKYKADDEWEVEVRGGAPEAGTKASNLTLTRF